MGRIYEPEVKPRVKDILAVALVSALRDSMKKSARLRQCAEGGLVARISVASFLLVVY